MNETLTPKASSEKRFPAGQLLNIAGDVLGALGVPQDLAALTAGSLVLANQLGHDSHGIQRLLPYSASIIDGQIQAAARPFLAGARGAVGTIDGQWGLGQPAARLATDTAIGLARDHGIGAVTITNCNHIGRLGEYVEMMASTGCIGWAMCNSGAIVAPAGGRRRTFGTNPLAWAVPVEGRPPLVLDFATSALAEGKVRLSLSRGETVAEGAIIDADGRPSVSPADLYDGGALLPFGGHKGSGMALMIELIGGLLSGMGTAPMPDYGGGNGTLMIAMDLSAFGDPDDFTRRAAEFADRVTEAADGTVEPGILLPGDIEQRTKIDRDVRGIPVPDAVRQELGVLAGEINVELGDFAAH